MVDVVLDAIAAEAGWDTDSQLALCLEYIGRQQDDPTFEDFLRQQAALELAAREPTDADTQD